MKASPKSARTSRAQRVVDKARRTKAAQGNVEDLPSTRLERGVADGRHTLTAVFHKKSGGKPDRLDLSFLLDFPGQADFFANAILTWGKQQRQTTRYERTRSLRTGWFTYLDQSGLADLVPSAIDEQIMTGFSSWVRQRRNPDGQPLHPNTIRHELGVLRVVFRNAPGAVHLMEMVPAGPRGAARKTNPSDVLRFDELLRVMAAVEKEVLALRDRWSEGRRLLEQGRQYLQQGKALVPNPQRRAEEARGEANLALTLAMLDHRYPGVIPDRSVIQEDHSLLAWTMNLALGGARTTRYFYATSRDLVPLALSIAFATVFNPSTILKLCWKNIDRNVDRLSNGRASVQFVVSDEDEDGESAAEAEPPGTPLTKVAGDKPRAGRQLVRLLDGEAGGPDQVSLNLVLDLLTEMTARIRPHVIDRDQYGDRVFLFVQQNSQKRPRGFALESRTGDMPWAHGLRKFVSDNRLPSFTLKTIRASLLDYSQLFNHGDLEAARLTGNHSSRVTTWTHYTSNLVKRLLQEAVAETMLLRERWLQSDGKLDPRKFRNWTNKGCATPGWVCLDPFDSPRPNQKTGTLCTAYGECPDCPLAAARPSNPRNVMLYEALRRAIYRSVARVTAAVWRERWAPVVAALDAMLTHVPAQILEESRKLAVELPDVG